MPVDTRKKVKSATQAELHSALKQKRLLIHKIPGDPRPQQRVGGKFGLASTQLEEAARKHPRFQYFLSRISE